jgi:glycerophosphoryl diester phosphodiesterase
VIAWTVNDPDSVRRLAGLQVDAIVSDDPGMVIHVLATLKTP